MSKERKPRPQESAPENSKQDRGDLPPDLILEGFFEKKSGEVDKIKNKEKNASDQLNQERDTLEKIYEKNPKEKRVHLIREQIKTLEEQLVLLESEIEKISKETVRWRTVVSRVIGFTFAVISSMGGGPPGGLSDIEFLKEPYAKKEKEALELGEKIRLLQKELDETEKNI